MKVAITGHTSGLGAALYNKYSELHQVKGFSRSNGYNINDYKTIGKAIVDYDIFINNAYNKFAQIDMINYVFSMWRNHKKTIVNISSLASSNFQSVLTKQLSPYAVHKSALDTAVMQLQLMKKPCKVINVRPGYIDKDNINVNALAEQIYDLSFNELNIVSISIAE